MIMCDEIKETTKSIPTNLNETKVICKIKKFYILLAFLLIIMILLIAVSIFLLHHKILSKTKIFITILQSQ